MFLFWGFLGSPRQFQGMTLGSQRGWLVALGDDGGGDGDGGDDDGDGGGEGGGGDDGGDGDDGGGGDGDGGGDGNGGDGDGDGDGDCLLYTSPSPRDATLSRMPSSA